MVAISYLTGNKAQMADMNSQLANRLNYWYVTIVQQQQQKPFKSQTSWDRLELKPNRSNQGSGT